MNYIMAGHNGRGSGAVSSFLDEGIETIVLRNLICLNLTKYGCLNYEVDDEDDKLNEVISRLRNKVKPDDILIDIHFNAADPKATGSEIFIPTNYDEVEKELACQLLNEVTATLAIRSRGVKVEGQSQHSRLGMLHLPCHTVLLEVCFLTNKSDVYKYKENREKLAERIVKILIEKTKK